MNNIINKLQDKNIAILGFGREGYSTYKYIRKYLKNQKITILDKIENIKDTYQELKDDNNLSFILGEGYLNNLEIYDIIIKTPGISLSLMLADSLKDKLTSQMDLVMTETDAYIIGVTGTKGKSTTSSLLYNVLKDQNKDVYLVGNIGNPILDYIDLVNKDTILVAEYSAHQLQFLKKSPQIGIILNLFEEHLDYFKELNNYYLSKMNMFKYQNSNNYGLYFLDNETLNSFVEQRKYESNLIPVSLSNIDKGFYCDGKYIYKKNVDETIKLYDLNNERNLVGMHNIINIMFVLAVVDILNLNNIDAIKSVNNFEPLNHRLQKVGKYNDIIFYSDTIATIPEATLNGINSLKEVDTLIFGGMDRGIDYSTFAKDLAQTSVNNFICMPDTGYKIGKELEKIVINKNVFFVSELDDAVDIAFNKTSKEKICLLSPSAPSYNKYKNYEDKGNHYIKCIKDYKKK